MVAVGVDPELAHHRLVLVDGGGGVGTLVRVDPDGDHGVLQAAVRTGCAPPAGRPDAGMGCRSSFEPRRWQDLTNGRFARKPTTVVAGHSGDTPVRSSTLRTRRAVHPTLHQGNLGIVTRWLMRGAAVVLLVAAACNSDGHVDAVVSGVDVDEDSIVLVAGCFEEAGGDAELRDGQIVVTSLWGEGKIDGDCATGVPLDLAPGPDVVDVEGGKRFALVGDSYRQIDYCGVETQRCVPFSVEPVAADCSLESLRFATVGMFAGVYPIEVVRCEGRWALVDIENCGGSTARRAPSAPAALNVSARC